MRNRPCGHLTETFFIGSSGESTNKTLSGSGSESSDKEVMEEVLRYLEKEAEHPGKKGVDELLDAQMRAGIISKEEGPDSRADTANPGEVLVGDEDEDLQAVLDAGKEDGEPIMLQKDLEEQAATESRDMATHNCEMPISSDPLQPKASSNMQDDTSSDKCPMLASPTDYRSEAGQELLRCHLVGCCCTENMQSLKGPKGKQVRQRAQRIRFTDLKRGTDNAWYLTITEPMGKRDDKISCINFNRDDLFPEEWVEQFWRHTT